MMIFQPESETQGRHAVRRRTRARGRTSPTYSLSRDSLERQGQGSIYAVRTDGWSLVTSKRVLMTQDVRNKIILIYTD
jgi:hypothetical protein